MGYHDNSLLRNTPVHLLDCTLRDGGFVNNFQFTKEQVAYVIKELQHAGVEFIEIGHGIGLGASDKGFTQAAETDEVYMKTAANSLSSAHWGMFCAPAIADLAHVELAIDHDMSFIRFGVDVDKVKDAIPYIKLAKSSGMFVCCNFLKSYKFNNKTFSSSAKVAIDAGADAIYIVDSTGGMLPEDVSSIASHTLNQIDNVILGFHGHDNLGLGIANALAAQASGVTMIDTTLQGLGRSSGNTKTEQFVCTLLRRGYDIGLDLLKLMELGDNYIRDILPEKGIDCIDTMLGYKQIHSGDLDSIIEQKSDGLTVIEHLYYNYT